MSVQLSQKPITILVHCRVPTLFHGANRAQMTPIGCCRNQDVVSSLPGTTVIIAFIRRHQKKVIKMDKCRINAGQGFFHKIYWNKGQDCPGKSTINGQSVKPLSKNRVAYRQSHSSSALNHSTFDPFSRVLLRSRERPVLFFISSAADNIANIWLSRGPLSWRQPIACLIRVFQSVAWQRWDSFKFLKRFNDVVLLPQCSLRFWKDINQLNIHLYELI